MTSPQPAVERSRNAFRPRRYKTRHPLLLTQHHTIDGGRSLPLLISHYVLNRLQRKHHGRRPLPERPIAAGSHWSLPTIRRPPLPTQASAARLHRKRVSLASIIVGGQRLWYATVQPARRCRYAVL